MTQPFHKINVMNSDTIIISFAGHDIMYGGIQRFEFLNFFNKNFDTISRHFYVDTNLTSYHKGIAGLTKNIDETVNYLRGEIQNYKNVIFIGVSSGGYAAILFGSLLNINSVIAFIPQTIRRNKNINEEYRDICGYINTTTKYYLYGDLSVKDANNCHHISHCERIAHHPNVFLTKQPQFNLKAMRDNGELYKLIHDSVVF